eukprot:scaffold16462_cov78-Skeletonema_dohrnii-CCMP3373.AAC.3
MKMKGPRSMAAADLTCVSVRLNHEHEPDTTRDVRICGEVEMSSATISRGLRERFSDLTDVLSHQNVDITITQDEIISPVEMKGPRSMAAADLTCVRLNHDHEHEPDTTRDVRICGEVEMSSATISRGFRERFSDLTDALSLGLTRLLTFLLARAAGLFLLGVTSQAHPASTQLFGAPLLATPHMDQWRIGVPSLSLEWTGCSVSKRHSMLILQHGIMRPNSNLGRLPVLL